MGLIANTEMRHLGVFYKAGDPIRPSHAVNRRSMRLYIRRRMIAWKSDGEEGGPPVWATFKTTRIVPAVVPQSEPVKVETKRGPGRPPKIHAQ